MKFTTEQFLAILQDIAKRIETGDSFEGNLSYSCMHDHLARGEWEVSAVYRTGNTEGQGGMRIINGEPG